MGETSSLKQSHSQKELKKWFKVALILLLIILFMIGWHLLLKFQNTKSHLPGYEQEKSCWRLFEILPELCKERASNKIRSDPSYKIYDFRCKKLHDQRFSRPAKQAFSETEDLQKENQKSIKQPLKQAKLFDDQSKVINKSAQQVLKNSPVTEPNQPKKEVQDNSQATESNTTHKQKSKEPVQPQKDSLIEKKKEQISKKLPFLKESEKIEKSWTQVLIKENPQKRLTSDNILNSYFKKYGGNPTDKASSAKILQKMNEKFETIAAQSSTTEKTQDGEPQKTTVLNSYVQQSQIKIEKIQFSAKNSNQNQYSIEGKIILHNLNESPKEFKIVSGTLFACKYLLSSQHVVVKELKERLEGKERREFLLKGFCADSALKWPHDDSNYDLTSFRLKNYNDHLTQDQIWAMTN